MRISYSYLAEQFKDVEPYLDDLTGLVRDGAFTLGPYVEAFEEQFSTYIGVKHAIGTNSGTDALILALKSVGVGPGDEVITVPNTFVATVGSIVSTGAKPVFVDSDERYQIDVSAIESAITSHTRAILPVHWGGSPSEIDEVVKIADKYGLAVVEDACPSVGAKVDGRSVGTFGKVSAFSMHPLKPLNVWGDGGVIVTDDDDIANYLRLYHNHGLSDRDHVDFWGINTRLQPIQALVGSRQLFGIDQIIETRIRNARYLDNALEDLSEFVTIPDRLTGHREVYQLYQIGVCNRKNLIAYLGNRDIETKVHYPIPLHLQNAAKTLGYKRGDFPVCERQANDILTLPAHQHISKEQIDYVSEAIHSFYENQ